MIYKCDECGKILPAGAAACPVCGETFKNAVPADAEARRGFSAMPDQDRTEHPRKRAEHRPAENAVSANLNSWLDPTPYAARPRVKGAAARALLVCAIIAVLAFVASREMGGRSSPSIPTVSRGTSPGQNNHP